MTDPNEPIPVLKPTPVPLEPKNLPTVPLPDATRQLGQTTMRWQVESPHAADAASGFGDFLARPVVWRTVGGVLVFLLLVGLRAYRVMSRQAEREAQREEITAPETVAVPASPRSVPPGYPGANGYPQAVPLDRTPPPYSERPGMPGYRFAPGNPSLPPPPPPGFPDPYARLRQSGAFPASGAGENLSPSERDQARIEAILREQQARQAQNETAPPSSFVPNERPQVAPGFAETPDRAPAQADTAPPAAPAPDTLPAPAPGAAQPGEQPPPAPPAEQTPPDSSGTTEPAPAPPAPGADIAPRFSAP